jgi:cytochrome c553
VLVELGEPIYQRYCASCHGADGRGAGPTAHALTTPPADLRRIAARRGGTFSDAEIARKIDGRFDIQAHGSREMPIWGGVFSSDIPDGDTAESITRGKLAVLIEYLKSIQDPPGGEHPQATRETMASIFEAMRYLLPLSLDADRFEDPAEQEKIRNALELLDRSSGVLERHGAGGEVGFAHLSRSQAIDARDVRLRFAEGHAREARYLIQTMTETCVACHSRLPADSAPRSDTFVLDNEREGLTLMEQAKLAYATRQFDVAAGMYELLLASEEVSANDLDLDGHIEDYLELSIRVQRDLRTPAEVLEQFARRDDLSPALREDVAGWITALRTVAARTPSGAPLADARALLGQTSLREDARIHLIEYLEASGILHRALSAGALADSQRAEAYFLLGSIEARIGRTYWLSQAEAYLETAIRLAPGQPTARQAYAMLEDFLVAGYSGSGGTHVPPDIRAKLDLLRFIAEGS